MRYLPVALVFAWCLTVVPLSAGAAGPALKVRPIGSDCTNGTFRVGALVLCNVSDALSSRPLIRREQKTFELLMQKDTEMAGLGWVGAQALTGSKLLVGVLDWQIESSGTALTVVRSIDGGTSWVRVSDISKPHDMAQFKSLELRSATHWVVQIALDDCADCGVKTGVRIWETADAGQHWSPREERSAQHGQ